MEIPRVVQVDIGVKDFGGVPSYLYNIYIHTDHDKIQFDFLTPNPIAYEMRRQEIADMGGKIYKLEAPEHGVKRKIAQYKFMKKFFREHHCQIVHSNTADILFNYVVIKAAKAAGVPHRIAHSHNAGTASKARLKQFVFRRLKRPLEHNATELYACSEKAARFTFTKKANVKIIKNGIDLARFDYNPAVREEMRCELGVGDKFVVGHIGRFAEQKNHRFLIDIFAKMPENAVLMLVGQGDLEDEIRTKVESLGLTDRVMFLGQRKDVEKLYQAMDVFLFPSLFEGLPVTCIELQTSGLPCVLSDEITKEVKINENMQFLPLSAPPEKWAEEVCKCAGMERRSHAAEVAKAGYSIEQVAKELQEHYLELVK